MREERLAAFQPQECEYKQRKHLGCNWASKSPAREVDGQVVTWVGGCVGWWMCGGGVIRENE